VSGKGRPTFKIFSRFRYYKTSNQ